MLRFQWNSLRIGDTVMVHDDVDPGFLLRSGVVRLVDVREGDTNEVASEVEHQRPVVHPRRHAVHELPLDRRACWRCEASAGRSAPADVDGAAA